MRCEKVAEFALPEDPEDDVRCKREATIRVDCTPAEGNTVGEAGTLDLCRECADYISSPFGPVSWIYVMTDMETGEPYETQPPTYSEVPVIAVLPRYILDSFLQSDQFRKAADEVLSIIRGSWQITCVKLEADETGVTGHTRSGERVLVRY